jgi:hypothetical protein
MLSVPRESPLNVYDVAATIGVEVHFVDSPSLEGMFYRGPNPRILLPSWQHRPKGRIAYSCGHELGHFQLGHGTRVDEYIAAPQGDTELSGQEFAADTFAAGLLMPRQAVNDRFARRAWSVDAATPLQVFVVAGELDVGYETLLRHLRYGLSLVDDSWMMSRLKVTPKQIRHDIACSDAPSRITVVDDHWPNVPIDLEIGDRIAIPAALATHGGSVVAGPYRHGDYTIFVSARAGEDDLHVNGRSHRVRVARAGFCGLLKYRFLADPDEA